MKRFSLLLWLALLSVLLVTVSCGGGEDKEATDSGADKSAETADKADSGESAESAEAKEESGGLELKEKGDTVLTFMLWGTPQEKKAVYEVLRSYQSEYPDVGLKVIHADSLAFRDKLQTMIAGGTPPDVFYVHVDSLYSLASKGLLYPLDEFVYSDGFNEDDFYPELMDAFKQGGSIYGVPKDWTSYVLYYNKKMFDEAGISYPDDTWTWDDLLAASQKLSKDEDGDGVLDQYGFIVEKYSDWYYSFIKQNDGEIFENGNKWVFASEKYFDANVEALQFLADLINKYKVAPNLGTVSQFGGSEGAFASGKVGMVMVGRWAQLTFKEIDDFEWDYAVLPKKEKRASTYVTVSLSMSMSTEYPKESWELIKYVTSYEGQIFTAESGLALPSRKSLMDSDSYLKAPQVLVNQPHLEKDSLDEDPFYIQRDYMVLAPANEHWLQVRQKIDEQMEDVFLGNNDAKSVVLKLDSVVNDIMNAGAIEMMVEEE